MMLTMAQAAAFNLFFLLWAHLFVPDIVVLHGPPTCLPCRFGGQPWWLRAAQFYPTHATHTITTLSLPPELALVSTFDSNPCPLSPSRCPLDCHTWCLIVVEGGGQQREAGHRQWHNGGVDLMMGVGKKDFILIICLSQSQREDHIHCRNRTGLHGAHCAGVGEWDPRWRRRDAKSREREGQDGDGEPRA